MSRGGVAVLNVPSFTKTPKLFIVELSIVVGDDDVGHSKSTHNGFSHKFNSFPLSDRGSRLRLSPFSKIVYRNNEKLGLTLFNRKWPNEVNPPKGKWPW